MKAWLRVALLALAAAAAFAGGALTASHGGPPSGSERARVSAGADTRPYFAGF